MVQIAGLIARRILCDVPEGEPVRAGARFGIIRFGSRTDLYLPEGVLPLVAVGQTMVGGETVMAELGPAERAVGPPVRGCGAGFGRGARPRVHGPSFNRMIPNLMTLLGLCAGLTSMRFALEARLGRRRWRWWWPAASMGWTAGWPGC